MCFWCTQFKYFLLLCFTAFKLTMKTKTCLLPVQSIYNDLLGLFFNHVRIIVLCLQLDYIFVFIVVKYYPQKVERQAHYVEVVYKK